MNRRSLDVPTKSKQGSRWIQKEASNDGSENAMSQFLGKGKKRDLHDVTPVNQKLCDLSACEKLDLEGLEAYFPYKPYPCQIEYMKTIARSLLNGTNAILESPTGTGKTLCVLTVVLAWQYAIQQGKIANKKVKVHTTASPSTTASKREAKGADAVADAMKKLYDFGAEESLIDKLDPKKVSPDLESTAFSKKVNSENAPRIFYASRTHAQLKQVMAEMKKTPYYTLARVGNTEGSLVDHLKKTDNRDIEDLPTPCDPALPRFTLRSTPLASRDHLCIHKEQRERSEAMSGNLLNTFCKKQTTNKTCLYHSGCDATLKARDLFASDVYDVDALRDIGITGHAKQAPRPFCPFYAAREAQKKCTFLFLPYVYLLTPTMRERLNISLANDVIIIDEAHNLESTAEDAVSFELTLHDIEQVISACDASPDVVQPSGETDSLSSDDAECLRNELSPCLQKLIERVLSLKLQPSPVDKNQECHPMTLPQFHEMLRQAGLTAESNDAQRSMLRHLSLALEAAAFNGEGAETENGQKMIWATKVENFSFCLSIIWNANVLAAAENFRAVIFKYEPVTQQTSKRTSLGPNPYQYVDLRKICFWSFAPHVAIMDFFTSKEVEACHSLIITSGTLKPLDALALQLGHKLIDFPNQLENDHVIKNEQLYAAVVAQGPSGSAITMNYDNMKKNPTIIQDVGAIILDVARSTPKDGILVFFPSYGTMHRCIQEWQRSGIHGQLLKAKALFVEPSDAQQAADSIDDFRLAVDKAHGIEENTKAKPKRRRSLHGGEQWQGNNGAVFLGVCRGRLSEGLSLSDHLVRVVIVIGIPYPAITDLRISLKRTILNCKPLASKSTTVTGGLWYARQASQAVNQAAGRVIRHKDDYGAIFFVDSRYTMPDRLGELSKWISRNICLRGFNKSTPWPILKEGLSDFLRVSNGGKECKSLPVDRHAKPVVSATATSKIQNIDNAQKPDRQQHQKKRKDLTKTTTPSLLSLLQCDGSQKSQVASSAASTYKRTLTHSAQPEGGKPSRFRLGARAASCQLESNLSSIIREVESQESQTRNEPVVSFNEAPRKALLGDAPAICLTTTASSGGDEVCPLCCDGQATGGNVSCCDRYVCYGCFMKCSSKCCFCQRAKPAWMAAIS